MIRYSGIFLSLLMLSGCATEALKNEQAESVISAGNKAVAAIASFFNQYYASRENFLVNFYEPNPECAQRPDYTIDEVYETLLVLSDVLTEVIKSDQN